MKVTEPNTTSSILPINLTTTYNFKSRGKGIIELGVNYSTGWLATDKVEFVVQGPILGLQLFLDSSAASPFKKKENLDLEFRMETVDQPYQIKRLVFHTIIFQLVRDHPYFSF